jgi:peptidoglycan/LPS O-acetylase OafA/YrhL
MARAAAAATGSDSLERLHLTHVDGLRAVAALVVFVNHAYAQAWYPGHGEYATGILSIFAYSLVAGHLAVSVFIVISGFCLTLPVVDAGDSLRRGMGDFFKRRARRILPPYYGALALSLLLIATMIGQPSGSLWDVPIQVDRVAVVSHFLLLQDLFGTGKINYVFWSIAVEWHIYFLFPLLVWATRRYGIPKVAIAALLVGYGLRFGFDGTRLERANPHFLGLFALGMLAAYVVRSPHPQYEQARKSRLWPWLWAGSLLLVLGLCARWGYRSPEEYFPYLDLPVGMMALGLLVHATLYKSSWLTRALNGRFIVLIGTFSYSVYLVHAPLLQVIWQYALKPLDLSPALIFALLMTVGAAAVLTTAYGFFKVCEEPFMQVKRRTEAQREATAAPVTP